MYIHVYYGLAILAEIVEMTETINNSNILVFRVEYRLSW